MKLRETIILATPVVRSDAASSEKEPFVAFWQSCFAWFSTHRETLGSNGLYCAWCLLPIRIFAVRVRALRSLDPVQPFGACAPPDSNCQELRVIIRIYRSFLKDNTHLEGFEIFTCLVVVLVTKGAVLL